MDVDEEDVLIFSLIFFSRFLPEKSIVQIFFTTIMVIPFPDTIH